MRIEVLGPVRALHDGGRPAELRGPRQREVLGRLVAADGAMVTTESLLADLWSTPGPGAVGALRTFVATLRRALEPARAARTPPRIVVTEGPGYALRLPRTQVDAYQFQDVLANARRGPRSLASVEPLGRALLQWQGAAFADLPDSPWVHVVRAEYEEMRLQARELRADVLIDHGEVAELLTELDAHVAEHPWREPAWGLLARALYGAGRQADALATLRRARTMLAERLGLDPGPALRRLEGDILAQSPALEPRTRTAAGGGFGPRTTVDLARTLAVAGGNALVASRRDRLQAALAAERTGDVLLTARVIGAYDVPAIWSRADDEAQAVEVVAVSRRTLAALGANGPVGLRARLHATVAIESRGADAGEDARQAQALARTVDDPELLAFALNGVFMQSFARPGLAAVRDHVGIELIELATRHRLATFGILGRLIRMQSAAACGDLDAGAGHAVAADRLAAEHEAPGVAVLTSWFRAMTMAASSTAAYGPSAAVAAAAYRAADASLAHAGMPGVRAGLLPLALLGLRLLHGRSAPTDARLDWGPYTSWTLPLVLLANEQRVGARDALADAPAPPPDHLQEALWCLIAHAAVQLDDREVAARAADALLPARRELAGAGSGMLTLGPVEGYRSAAERCANGR